MDRSRFNSRPAMKTNILCLVFLSVHHVLVDGLTLEKAFGAQPATVTVSLIQQPSLSSLENDPPSRTNSQHWKPGLVFESEHEGMTLEESKYGASRIQRPHSTNATLGESSLEARDLLSSGSQLRNGTETRDEQVDASSLNNPDERSRKTSDASVHPRQKRSLHRGSVSLIPPEYRLVVHIRSVASTVNQSLDSTIRRLKAALASEVPWPVADIHVDKINFADSDIEFYFRNAMGQLVLVTDLMSGDLLERVSQQVPDLGLTRMESEDNIIQQSKYEHIWNRPYFPYLVAGCSVTLAMLALLLIYCCCCRSADKVDGATDEEEGVVVTHAILYPALKPELGDPTPIQPDVLVTPFAPAGITTPIQTQPMRIKAKGLLERRGSNASLTLDLNPSHDTGRWEGTPPKESTALEYLMSAGNRLSRRDLRNAVKQTTILYEEFWEIPMNHTEKVCVAGSGMKNRYKTIIPNEHSRVILPDIDNDPLNSYINASYIRGYEGEPHAYIATQGPMAHTILDFWRMIWAEKCPIIVMITKLKEKSNPKCENYLPERWGIYGDIEIIIDKVFYKKGYVLRHITLRCNGESQSILHYWYTTWPDHKPPDSPNMLLDLVKEVELRTPRGPVCVHCSAGIGRTGCFVAISIGIRQLREEHSVDALGIVCSMRMDRGGMIQTHEQYDFVHQALAAYERELGEPSVQSITALTTDSITTP